MYNNVRPCLTHVDIDKQTFYIDNGISYFFLHLNIASLQAHFDELNEFHNNFINPPTIIFLSETEVCRIRVQESTLAGVGVFQQEPEQNQEWKFSIGTGAGVIFNHNVHEIILSICILCDL